MSDFFKSFPTGDEILIFTAQGHYQYPWSEATIIINGPHFQATVLMFKVPATFRGKAKHSVAFNGGGRRLAMGNLLQCAYCSRSSSCWFVYHSSCALDYLFMNIWKPRHSRGSHPCVWMEWSGSFVTQWCFGQHHHSNQPVSPTVVLYILQMASKHIGSHVPFKLSTCVQ